MARTKSGTNRRATARPSAGQRRTLPVAASGEVVHKPAAQEIGDRIIDLIEQQEFLPGERLREQDLADRFDVTRARVREALHILEARNFVTIERMKGAAITRLETADVIAIGQVRGALMELAARRAAELATAAESKRIAEHAGRLAEGATVMTPREFRTATQKLGDAICTAAHSAYIARIFSDVHRSHGGMRFYSLLGVSSRARRVQSSRNWAKVADAIQAGQAQTAERIVRKIYNDAIATVEDIVAGGGPD